MKFRIFILKKRRVVENNGFSPWYKMKVLEDYRTAPMSVSLDRVPFVDKIFKRESIGRPLCLSYRSPEKIWILLSQMKRVIKP